jgi:N-acetylmuramoyl-L-alanine amidase
MKKILLLCSCLLCLFLTACANNTNVPKAATAPAGAETKSTAPTSATSTASTPQIEIPTIIDKPVLWSANKEKLVREYAQLHYSKDITTIVPQAVVVHWTASATMKPAFDWFYKEAMADGTLNVGSQFMVDRDGTIYRLTPETALTRHIIGYNWCAIGIENVGGANNKKEDLTPAQLTANIKLINYLHAKYPTIKYVFGHYQQIKAHKSGLYIENVKGYHSDKVDPGPKFMKGLKKALIKENLVFFD